jgi:membrane protease YdiL (CAAX protease family)
VAVMSTELGGAGARDQPAAWRLWAWIILVAILVAAQYAGRAIGGEADRDALYKTGTAITASVVELFLLSLAMGIAGTTRLLALRHPRSWVRSLLLAGAVFILVSGVSAALDPLLHADREQGITPDHWDPSRANAYTLNFIVIAALVPITEEIVFRGVGYSLLERLGTPVAIAGSAVAFALAHGLVQGFPTLLVFGLGLGWLRYRTHSVIPGIAVHASFNALALILAVTT